MISLEHLCTDGTVTKEGNNSNLENKSWGLWQALASVFKPEALAALGREK